MWFYIALVAIGAFGVAWCIQERRLLALRRQVQVRDPKTGRFRAKHKNCGSHGSE